MLDFSLTDAQEKLKVKARDFAMEQVLPAIWHYDKYDSFPRFLLEKAREAGLMNADIPSEYGGRGLEKVDAAIITEEIAAACPGMATSIFDNSLGMEPLLLSRNKSLKEKILPQIARGDKFIAFALSETGAGSDVGGIRCRARKENNHYIIHGRKFWITNGSVADYFTVFATIDHKARELGIAAFLVERDREGVSVGEQIPKMGQHTSNTTAVRFNKVKIPEENLLADPPRGFLLAMKTFAQTRPMIGAFAVGGARTALDTAVHYVKKRKAFGTEIAQHQMIQAKLAEMYQKVETSRLLVWRAAAEADRGKDPTVFASIAKFYSTEKAMEVVSDAMQILGGYGYSSLFPLEKLLRDIRLLTIYEGTSEIQRKIVSSHVLSSYKPVMPAPEKIPMIREIDLSQEENKSKIAWRCDICGYVYYGSEAPKECPVCLYPGTAFKKVWPPSDVI